LDAIDRYTGHGRIDVRYDPCRQADFDAVARFRVRRAIRKALTDQAVALPLAAVLPERRPLWPPETAGSRSQTSPFKGPVYDQSGKLRVKKGVQPPASFEQNVNWFVKGMIGRTR